VEDKVSRLRDTGGMRFGAGRMGAFSICAPLVIVSAGGIIAGGRKLKAWVPVHFDVVDVTVHKGDHVFRIVNAALSGG